MKKIFLLIPLILLGLFISQSFSTEEVWTVFIDQTELKTDPPILNVDGSIYVPMTSAFRNLGAQVFKEDALIAYYLNSFVKVDLKKNQYAVNGKIFKFKDKPFYRNDVLYIPLKVLTRAFDLIIDRTEESTLYLKANTVIQYRFFDEIQYKQISFDDHGARFSVPLDWLNLEPSIYGYDSNYGRISVTFSSVTLNENIDKFVVMDTYKEHLMIDYPEGINEIKEELALFDHLISNVLYIDLDVNDKGNKKVVHFIESENLIYILDFQYPVNISEIYMTRVIQNMLSTFYINALTFDPSNEHYFETQAATRLRMTLDNETYANMTVENNFYFSGHFNTVQPVESLTIKVSRDEELIEFYVPVTNNYFETWVYTPFGLGKHNVKVSITAPEEKVVLDQEIEFDQMQSKAKDLLHFSVVNVDNTPLRHLIPTKMVQSQHEFLTSMSQLLTYKNNTLYSKARSIFDFIVENIEVLPVNTTNFSALDVYTQYKGTQLEIAYYTTALLRAQNIPARIVRGKNNFAVHYWVEADLNGRWLIIDTTGDQSYQTFIEYEEDLPFPPTFNGSTNDYTTRYPQQTILNH